MLILVRHGQSLYNEANLLTGHVDTKLSKKGISEAEAIGDELKSKSIRFDYAFTSPLSRCTETTDIILEKTFSVCDVVNVKRLIERDCGDLSGIDKSEAILKMGERKFRTMRRSFDISYPNGESFDDVTNRIVSWIQEDLLPLRNKGQTLVVSHKHTLRALCFLLGIVNENDVQSYNIPNGNIIYVPWISLKTNILV
jgi:2,3-bisphosphoglycerate-dependent phosphoglycerate mutase|tara:strand:- start:858 stop:1448 length:591 start_codon:yes stop_codon:yes gene_type:complete